MVERCQDVTLAVQAAAQTGVQRSVVQYLDGHRLLVLGIVPLAAIDRAHAAVTQDGHDAVVADASADQTVLMLHEQRFSRLADGIHQGILGPSIRGQQRLDRALELPIAFADGRQARGLLGGRRVDDLIEQRLNLLPARAWDHVGEYPAISCSSHARASRISRCTVAAEAPLSAAI